MLEKFERCEIWAKFISAGQPYEHKRCAEQTLHNLQQNRSLIGIKHKMYCPC